MMYPYLNYKAIHAAFVLLLLNVSSHGFAASLTIGEAERLALTNDYTLQAIQARGQSMKELSVATASLPDPQLKLGFANLPTDSFNLGQEPMTQTVIGIRQQFPRGKSREFNSTRVLAGAARNDAEADDRTQRIRLAVREEFIQIHLHGQRRQILQQSQTAFADLAEITQDYYESGRAHQQEVVQTQLELSRVEERLSRIRQEEEEARVRLAERIGDAAFLEFAPGWPDIAQPLPEQQIISRLASHPRLRAWQHEIEKTRAGEEVARQAYKPGFALDLAYGGRGGRNMDGSDRSDFLSVFVTMDIPLFTRNRQDRVLASNIAMTAATQYARDDIHRSMRRQVAEQYTALERERQRLELYTQTLLPQAAFNAESAFEDYQDAFADLTVVMRARIGEYELRLEHAALLASEILTRARLLYLQGENS